MGSDGSVSDLWLVADLYPVKRKVPYSSQLGERESFGVLAHSRKAEDTVVHDGVDSRGNEPGGKERLDNVLQGIGVSKLVGSRCAGEDHRSGETS